MCDRSISLLTILATTSWVAATFLVTLALVCNQPNVGDLGLLFAAGAVTLNMRKFLHALRGRERDAFELGRESASEYVRAVK